MGYEAAHGRKDPFLETAAQPVSDALIAEKALNILKSRQALFLSTTHGDTPWVAGASFAEIDVFTLTLILENGGTTLANIRANNKVAVVVSSGASYEPFMQGEAEAVVLSDDEAENTRAALVAKIPGIEALFGYPHHAVRLNVRAWKVTDLPSGWIPAKVLTPQSVAVAA
jgi:hypothetical protein